MSEAEKSTEIEDVLSSIRRLVADGSHAAMEPEKQVDGKLGSPKLQTELDVNVEPTFESDVKPDFRPKNFVDKINASIAEIKRQEKDTPNAKNEPQITSAATETHTENQDDTPAPTAKAEQEKPATVEPVVIALKKPEPLVLRADMAATLKKAPVEEVENAEPVVVTVFQEMPKDDDLEIVMPDDIEDDEVALETTTAAKHSATEPSISEDALREIVCELVRAELQGDLGDRITRNVRKLVRREIHHALATRELD